MTSLLKLRCHMRSYQLVALKKSQGIDTVSIRGTHFSISTKLELSVQQTKDGFRMTLVERLSLVVPG